MAPMATRRKRLNDELLDVAAAGRHRDVERLLKENADIEAMDRSGYTAISEAAMAGHTVVVGQLLRALADPNRHAQDGRTALHRAAFHGWLPVVNLLLEKGADPSLKDDKGEQPADITQHGMVRETLMNLPAEQTRAALEERKKQLALLPPPPPDSAEEEQTLLENEAAPVAVNIAAATPSGDLTFSPPPRCSAVQTPTKAADQAKADKERKYKQALTEFRVQTDETTGDDIVYQTGPPLTAKIQVNGSGEERLNGTYCVSFATKDRIEFEKLDDKDCQIFWTEWQDEWRMVAGDVKLGSTLYRHKYRPNVKADECHGVPRSGWQKWFGKEPAPTVCYLPNAGSGNDLDNDEETEEHAHDEFGKNSNSNDGVAVGIVGGQDIQSCGEQEGVSSQLPASGSGKAEFIELHPRLEIVTPEAEKKTRDSERLATGEIHVSLSRGEGLVETADGLFGVEELPKENTDTAVTVDPDVVAAAWLESIGNAPEVPATWEAVQAAKAAAQDLFAEGKVGDARQATTAAIKALRRLAECIGESHLDDRSSIPGEGDDDHHHGGNESCRHVPCANEVETLLGVLYSNRSLLLLQQIQAGDSEVLTFGPEAAWRLIVTDADAALYSNPSNFKASFRRAHALFELGELEDALTDATLVVDYYSRTSQTPNPEAAALRDRILEAIRAERNKWGEKGNRRWNRGTHEPLITEFGSVKITSRPEEQPLNPRTLPVHPFQEKKETGQKASMALMQRLASTASRPPPVPKMGGDVEKALLSTLKGDSAQQLAYVREHLTVPALQRFYRKAPLGPDLLARLIHILCDLVEKDAALAGELLKTIAITPSAATHAAMFDEEERSALRRVLGRVGPEAVVAWESFESL